MIVWAQTPHLPWDWWDHQHHWKTLCSCQLFEEASVRQWLSHTFGQAAVLGSCPQGSILCRSDPLKTCPSPSNKVPKIMSVSSCPFECLFLCQRLSSFLTFQSYHLQHCHNRKASSFGWVVSSCYIAYLISLLVKVLALPIGGTKAVIYKEAWITNRHEEKVK